MICFDPVQLFGMIDDRNVALQCSCVIMRGLGHPRHCTCRAVSGKSTERDERLRIELNEITRAYSYRTGPNYM